jgi:hypothetical protein
MPDYAGCKMEKILFFNQRGFGQKAVEMRPAAINDSADRSSLEMTADVI